MSIVVHSGDCREVLKTLPDCSVQMCLTSPPYYGLRDYGTATWEGGIVECQHSVGGQVQDSKAPGAIQTGVRPGVDASRCRKCGARRIDSQIGLEPTPDEYVAEMVAVFREVRRVLRDDGCLFLNLGDSYAAGKSGRSDHGSGDPTCRLGPKRDGIPGGSTMPTKQRPAPPGYKPKDLIGIPWMTAFALRTDGWYLRSDCIWSKPNPMPESVTDRPTKSHEYVFLLTKSARYFYDSEAVAEPAEPESEARYKSAFGGKKNEHLLSSGQVHTRPIGMRDFKGTRNLRTVWTIATQPYAGAHFATMPPDLAQLCIKAGSRRGDTVLDPFGGSGTTGLVADRLGRSAVLIDLNEQYQGMAKARIRDDAPLFAEVS